MLHRSSLDLQPNPLKWGLVGRVDDSAAKLLEYGLGAYSWCDRWALLRITPRS